MGPPQEHVAPCLVGSWLIGSGCCLVTRLCLTLCDPRDCSPPGSSVHRIFQARILEFCHFLLQEIFLTQGSNSPGLRPEDSGGQCSAGIAGRCCPLLAQWSPTLLAPGTAFVEDNFSLDGVGGGWLLDDSRVLHLLCSYSYISPTSDHQALAPGGWGPLL